MINQKGNIVSGKGKKKDQKKSSEEILSFGTSLTIADVESLYKQLKTLLKSEATVVIDAHEISSVDTAALQLLGAFIHEAGSHGIEVRWQEPSAVLRDSVHRLDMVQLLMLEAA